MRGSKMGGVRVGIFAPVGPFFSTIEPQAMAFARIADSGIDHTCVSDHVSFFNGSGTDALIDAATVLNACPEMPCYTSVYLLPLRSPVVVARQLASIAQQAPGRLTFGVGLGGEDPHEFEICGVDPRTRGRRMNECLQILRALADGEPISFDGEFFSLRDAQIVPAPIPTIPIIVGGRSDAAVRRAGRFGDGWTGLWVLPHRFSSAVERIAEHAIDAGRDPSGFEHAINVWCGFGPSRDVARVHLSAEMERFYNAPFEPFERFAPYGTPQDVAEFLHPYIEAGCSVFNMVACASDRETAVAGVAELQRLLTGARVST
jgi:alkanesulfonate monooxygenase SsuD/methylene tetrahydromethanopterin reductase-like flavin-dependent oxidoreductase (luciferase family)